MRSYGLADKWGLHGTETQAPVTNETSVCHGSVMQRG
jgi:hypothetical protein